MEQGARLAIKLETFSSALIARQYEAKISKLDGIAETLPASKKMELIKQPFDHADGERELRQKLLEIEQKIGDVVSEIRANSLRRLFSNHWR